jgi:tetratricopeptide (TPR) repeat protein
MPLGSTAAPEPIRAERPDTRILPVLCASFAPAWRATLLALEALLQQEAVPVRRMKVFVSHSSEDKAFAHTLVDALRGAGADVWYDELNLGPGRLLDIIQKELARRPVFIVVLSKAAFTSGWVRDECRWAYNLFKRTPSRIVMPVVASPIDPSDFNAMLYMEDFTRIEGPGDQPFPPPEAIERTLRLLALVPEGTVPAPTTPQPAESLDDLIARGKGLLAQERYAEALPFLEQATRQSPRSHRAWFAFGYTLGNLGRYDQAAAAFDKATQLKAGDAPSWYNKGLALENLDRLDEAMIALDRSLSLDPSYPEAERERAVALHRLGRYEEALVACEHALELDPTFADAHLTKGTLLSALGRDDDAVAAYDTVLVLKPENAYALHNKGHALLELRRYAGALAAYDQAIALDAYDAWAWNGKGYVYLEQGRYDEALQCVNRAAELAPEDGMYWDSRGEVYLRLKRYEEALFNFNHALTLGQTGAPAWESSAWENKAVALRALGREVEAKDAERRSKELGTRH